MQLDHFDAQLMGHIDLLQGRIDKQTDANTRSLKSFDRRLEFLSIRHNIETAFGRHFLALFWDKTDFVGHNSQSNIDNLRRVAHFQIQFGHDVLAKPIDVAVLYMAPVAAQMRNYPLRAGAIYRTATSIGFARTS